MTVRAQSADGYEVNYLHHTSPREDIPPQATPYYGHYSVSEQPSDADGAAVHFSSPYGSFVPTVEATDPGAFFEHQAAAHLYAHSMVTSAAPPAPILSQPHPSLFRTARGGTIEDLRDPAMLQRMTQQAGQSMYAQSAASTSPQPKRRPASSSKRSSRSQSSRQPSADAAATRQAAQAAGDGGDGLDSTAPLLTLDDKASEEDRFLFQARQALQGEKGKGMWDVIMAKYEERFHCEIQKPALQMKMSRLIRRCAKWPQSEVSFHPPAPLDVKSK